MPEDQTSVKVNNSQIAYCQIPIQIRETSEGEFYTDSWIYTTHPDRAKDGNPKLTGTIFSKRCMEQIVDWTNKGDKGLTIIGSRRAVSDEHDWIIEQNPNLDPVGMAVPPFEVREYVDKDGNKDGHFGVWGTTHYDKFHPDFEKTKSRIINGYYPGNSIEFIEGESREISVSGRVYKFIESLKEYMGYGLARARVIANPLAEIVNFGYRTVEESLVEKKEENTMTEEIKKASVEPAKQEQVINQAVIEAIQSPKAEAIVEVRTAEVDTEKIMAQLRTEMSKEIDAIKISTRVAKTSKEEDKMESISFRMMKDSLANNDLPKFRVAAREYAVENDVVRKAFADPRSYTEGFKGTLQVRAAGNKLQIVSGIQVRGTLDTNGNTEPTYTQQGAEFADIYQPGLIDTFNNQTNYFGFIDKEDHIEGGQYVGWTLITGQNNASNTVHVDFDETTVTKSFSDKEKMRTDIKIARVGISVADSTLRYSARSLGDLFQRELEVGMNYMMNDVDAKLFAETADSAGAGPLGLEAVADVTGNTSIYGKTRSTANRLTTGTLANTYVNQNAAISEAALRNGIEKITTRGTPIGRVAIVTSPKGKNFLFNLIDTNRRFNNTMAEFGFNQNSIATYDGIPIIVDHNCNSTIATAASSSACLYFIDRDQAKIVVGMAPTVTNLAKVGAATEAYLEMDYAHVYKDPCRIHMVDNFTTG